MNGRTVVILAFAFMLIIIYGGIGWLSVQINGHDHCFGASKSFDPLCFVDNVQELVGIKDRHHAP